MPETDDAPEIILNRALAQLLHDAGLAVYAPTGAIPERGIRLDGQMPTTVAEFTMLTSFPPISEGRADRTFRVQFYTRRTGSALVAKRWRADLADVLDHKAYMPAVLGISWAWQLSGLDFEPDTQGRSATAVTYLFRGRR